jgi:hypothetical protein
MSYIDVSLFDGDDDEQSEPHEPLLHPYTMQMSDRNEEDDHDDHNNNNSGAPNSGVTKVSVFIIFLKCDEAARKHFKNRMAATYTGSPYIHCEAYFPLTRESVSIDTRNPVYFMKDKDYSTRKWIWYEIKVTEKQYSSMYKFCKSVEGEGFDMWALFTFFMPVGCCVFPSNGKWLCSKLISRMLYEGNVITNIDSDVMTPALLHTLVKRTSRMQEYHYEPDSAISYQDDTRSVF